MVTGANRHDSVVFEALVDAIPSVPGLSGRPRCRFDKLHADKGYDFARCRLLISLCSPWLAPSSVCDLSIDVFREPLINEVGEWNRESRHLGFSD